MQSNAFRILLGLAAGWGLCFGSKAASGIAVKSLPRYTLKATSTWRLEPPTHGRFDASALLRLPSGELWTVNDKDGGVYRIQYESSTNVARLVRLNLFTRDQLQQCCPQLLTGIFDAEALARDAQGRIYITEEQNRSVLRYDPQSQSVERLPIDWTHVKRYFSSLDRNASLEGIAVSADRIYVANERQVGRIIEVDLRTLGVVGNFQASPFGQNAADVAYSDLCWYGDQLWVLCRQSRCVLRLAMPSQKVVAQYDYGAIETAGENVYFTALPFGFMEGLAVDDESIWLVVDNNGFPRAADRSDTRPTLFRCPRPDL